MVADRVTWNGENCCSNWSWVREITGRTRGELIELEGLISGARMEVDKQDCWSWKLCGTGIFSTSSLTKFIMKSCYPTTASCIPTQKNYLAPKKVGIFAWRARRKRLPVFFELDKRGIDLHSVLCPLCDDEIETVDHALFSCTKVREVWDKIFNWRGVTSNQLNLDGILGGSVNLQLSKVGEKIWQAMIWTSLYLIWKNRNNKIFKKSSWSPPVALCDIQAMSYEWIGKRCKIKKEIKNIEWLTWLHNPQSIDL
ncbi:uncharacterized protein [Rutidosis leptorrhynchoides]|uniref:uncharacterized protein n=1 Tax=Rutidosis leptorrhynchoides TaxID=125765 RepID=UPI003A996E39